MCPLLLIHQPFQPFGPKAASIPLSMHCQIHWQTKALSGEEQLSCTTATPH